MKPILLGWLFSLVPQFILAQVESAPLILTLPESVRAAALGGKSPVDPEPGDVWWNPALAADARGVGLSWSQYGSQATVGGLTGVTEWDGFGVAVAIRSAAFGVADVASTPGASQIFSGGTTAVSEVVGSFAIARELGIFRIGVAGSLVERRLGNSSGGTGAFGFGVLVDWLGLTWGGSVSHLGPAIAQDTVSVPLPTQIAFSTGLSSTAVGPVDVSAFASVVRLYEGDIVPSLGVEVAYWPIQGRTFIVRGGVRPGSNGGEPDVLTFGLGFRADAVTLAYASERLGQVGTTHQFGIWWR